MSLQEEYRMILQTDYCAYVHHVHKGMWIPSKFHKFLCDTIQDFVETDTGHSFDILILSTPPQHGKSQSVSETLPSWYLGRHPLHRVIEVSYNEDYAQKFGRRNRMKIKEYGQIFGINTATTPDTNTEFELDNGVGGMISRGVMTGITGNPANLMIIDDPIKNRAEAFSEAYRDRLWNEWLYSMKTRLWRGAKVILILTRWHEDDLAGRIIENEKNVTVVNIPLEAEEDDPLGRKVGDSLCPEIGKDNVWLADFKAGYVSTEGSMAWNALFQGHPTGMEGNLFHRSWWQFYGELPEIADWVMSVDAAFKDGEDNDFVAIQVWGKTGANIYLIDAVKKHLNLPDTIREIVRLRNLYPECKTTLIEDKANGSAVINIMRKMMTGIIAVEPRGGKFSRAAAVVGSVESGNVYLPKNKPFVGDFIDECSAFPNGAHDDQCFVAGTKIATIYGDKNIEDIKPGDIVITPFGNRRVLDCGCTGEKEVIEFCGIKGTPDHKFVVNGEFSTMCSLTQAVNCDKLSLREVIKWKYRKLLLSMELNTDLWGRGNITLLSQLPMKGESIPKDFMLRYGNFIMEKKFRKATKFITKTAIILITTFLTLSVYHAANILRSIFQNLWNIATAKKRENIWMKSGRLQKDGIHQKRGSSGIKNIMKNHSDWFKARNMYANNAEDDLKQSTKQDSVLITANKSGELQNNQHMRCENVLSAEKSSKQKSLTEIKKEVQKPVVGNAEESSSGNAKEKVYNLTVEKDHLYYAGGFLVSNCDAMSQALTRLIYHAAELKRVKPVNPIDKMFPGLKKTGKKTGRGSKINVV